MTQLIRNFLLGALFALALPAAAYDGFDLSNYRTSVVDDSIVLNADFVFALPRRIEDALDGGADLTFVIQIEVYSPRDYLPDKNLVSIEIRRRLSYDAQTKKYAVDDLTFGRLDSRHTLHNALADIGEVSDIRLNDAALARANQESLVRLRLDLSLVELPLPLRLRAIFLPDWYFTSPWFAWKLN